MTYIYLKMTKKIIAKEYGNSVLSQMYGIKYGQIIVVDTQLSRTSRYLVWQEFLAWTKTNKERRQIYIGSDSSKYNNSTSNICLYCHLGEMCAL
jgi:hypothetical protein